MPPTSGFVPLTTSEPTSEPGAEEVVEAVAQAYREDPRKLNPVVKRNDGGEIDQGVVFAGLGDPLLRLGVLCDAARGIQEVQPSVPLHVNTNGLAAHDYVDEYVKALHDAGISSATVALNAHTPPLYDALMLRIPPFAPDVYGAVEADVAAALAVGYVPNGAGFGTVCNFISTLSETGVRVTATCVDAPGVNVTATRQLAQALGALSFKVRSWHG